MPFTPQCLVLLINLLWFFTAAGAGENSIQQIPASISVQEGERIHIVCAFNITDQTELDLVVFTWTVGNVSIEAIKSRSNGRYISELSGTEVRIRADLTRRQTNLTVEHAGLEHSGLYLCHVTIIKPLTMQKDLQGNGTVVTVKEAKRTSLLIAFLPAIGVLVLLSLVVLLLIRRTPRGELERAASQCERDPQLLNLETIYSSLRFSLMRSPEKQNHSVSQANVYCHVQPPETSVSQFTVSHTVQMHQPNVPSRAASSYPFGRDSANT